jgi:hypothetical protein
MKSGFAAISFVPPDVVISHAYKSTTPQLCGEQSDSDDSRLLAHIQRSLFTRHVSL